MKYLNYLYGLLILLVIGGGIWAIVSWRNSEGADNVTINPAQVREIKQMASQCSMEVYDDVPIRASIGSRHMFARMSVKGSVNFNLDNADISLSGDTIFVKLPKEKIRVLESTDPDSYQVIDTWNTKLLGSDNFTADEENKIKEKIRQAWVKRIYANGTVRRARKEAKSNLQTLLQTAFGRTVIVTD